MRKIVAGMMVSVDGVVEAPEAWTTTLSRADWENTTLIGADVAGEVARLKQQPGKNINVSGSPTLVTWLLRQGLLDELNLLLFPVVVGHGKRLFEAEDNATGLTLSHSQALDRGVIQIVDSAAPTQDGAHHA